MPNNDKTPRIIFRLDEVLAEKQRGVREIARATKIETATISRIVNNRSRGISNRILGALCAELGISPGELYKVVETDDLENPGGEA